MWAVPGSTPGARCRPPSGRPDARARVDDGWRPTMARLEAPLVLSRQRHVHRAAARCQRHRCSTGERSRLSRLGERRTLGPCAVTEPQDPAAAPRERAARDGAQHEGRDHRAQQRDPAARQDDGHADGDDDDRPQPPDPTALPGIDPAESIGERDAAQQDEEDPPEQVTAMDAHDLATDRIRSGSHSTLPTDATMMDRHRSRCPVRSASALRPDA